MRAVLVATLPLAALLACIPPETEDVQSPCKSENHCVSEGRDFLCEAGYEWENPDDEDNYNCVAITGAEGEGEGPGVINWDLPAGGHGSQGYYATDGSGGVGSGKWSLVDMDGDRRPDLVITAETDASGDFVQLGFPNDGHWLVHKNTGSGFANTGTKWRLPAGGHSSQGYYATDGSGGVGSDKWSLIDMDGDQRPDLVLTAETNASGDFVQRGFPNEGHWLVHKNTGSGFARQ